MAGISSIFGSTSLGLPAAGLAAAGPPEVSSAGQEDSSFDMAAGAPRRRMGRLGSYSSELLLGAGAGVGGGAALAVCCGGFCAGGWLGGGLGAGGFSSPGRRKIGGPES